MRPLPKSKPLVPRGESFGLVVLRDFYSLASEYMKQRRRIIPRFGLRSILVITAIVAAICGGWLVQARRQRDACAQLESVGVELRMEDPAVWLRWLPQYILNYDGGHYFCPVTEADLCAVNGGPSPLIPLLAQLPQLRVLRIDQESFGSESISGLARCSSLESLDLSHGDFDDECLSQLPRMPRLKSLDLTSNYKCSKPNLQLPQLDKLNLWNTQANDETLSQIAKLTQLRWLSLDSAPVSDAGIASLRRLKKLETLELNSTSTTGESVAGIRSLRSLSLSNTLLEDRNFAAICEMPSLENLDVGGCRGITDAALVRLVNNKTLQSLNLSGCRRISQDSVDTISQIATLKSLSIDGTGITALTKLERLSQLNNLSHSIDEVEIEELLSFSDQVRLSLTGMAGRGNSRRNPKIVLDGIAGLCAKHFMNLDPDVECLSLSGSRFESEIFWVINSWPKLKSLCLNGSSISNQDLNAIGEMTNLRSLQLNRTEIDDVGLSRLVALNELTELSLTDTHVTQASMTLISGFTKLTKLELPFVPEPESLLKLLANCRWLEEIYCCKADLVGSDGRLRREVYEFSLANQRELNLGELRLTGRQLEQVLNLRNFWILKSSALTDEACEVIISDSTIHALNLAGSPITDAGMAILSSRERWRVLDLTKTKVTPDGIKMLSKGPNRVDRLIYDDIDNSNEFIEAISELKSINQLFYPVSRLSRDDAIKFLTCCYDRQIKLVDFDLPFHFGNSGDVQTGWMLGRSPFDPDLSHINLLGPLIDNRKLQDFEPSSNCEFVSAIGVSCDPERLIDKLITCPNLYALTLRRIPLSIEAIAKFKNLKLLRRLQLTECGLNDSHLPILAGLSQVEELILDSNQIEGQQLDRFTGAMQLDLLSLRMNPLTSNARRTAGQLAKQSRWLRIVR